MRQGITQGLAAPTIIYRWCLSSGTWRRPGGGRCRLLETNFLLIKIIRIVTLTHLLKTFILCAWSWPRSPTSIVMRVVTWSWHWRHLLAALFKEIAAPHARAGSLCHLFWLS